MSEVDRLSNSGLYPMLPIADKRPSRDRSGDTPHGGKPPPDKPAPQAGESPDPANPRPPKSLIDEYA
ncbi:MAG TPA: hypothetical protein VKG63_00475 [Steroidobacteraceae bacterium]|nr:hypothetical protein [Steroidobacteraceae bacterium]